MVPNSLDRVIAENIIIRMNAAGLNQKELAEKAGLAKNTLNKILCFKSRAGTNSLEYISHALGCSRLELTQPSQLRVVKPSPTPSTICKLIFDFCEATEETRGAVFDLLKRS